MPAPPYSCGTEHPSSPRSAICGRIAGIEAVLTIELTNPRRDFARAPLTNRLLEEPLLLGQIEIKHEDALAAENIDVLDPMKRVNLISRSVLQPLDDLDHRTPCRGRGARRRSSELAASSR